MKVGLYFGSYNPLHIGHLIVADAMLETIALDEVWLVISPQNPLKQKDSLIHEQHRLAMAAIGTADHPKIKTCDIEFSLTKPSYTIHTLSALKEKYPDIDFSLIMGSDNLIHFDKWKSYEAILESITIYVYTRETEEDIPVRWKDHPAIKLHPMPLINVSSTAIRRKIKEGSSFRYWVKDEVHNYILAHRLYQ